LKIFIAGGSGVIGRRVVPMLRSQGHEVTAPSSSEVSVFSPGNALRGHDVVINLATRIPPASKAMMPGAWRATAKIRREASAILIKAAAAAGVKRFIQESFAPIYAAQGDRWIDETSPIKPARYNRAIADAERNAASFPGDWVVLRFAFFYGPDSDFTQQMMGMVRKGWAASFGSPDGFISSVSHDDAAAAVVAALTIPPGIYNVVDDEPLTKRDFNNALADALGVKHPRFLPSWVRYFAGSLGETLARSQRISNRKLREASSWRPVHPSASDGWRSVVSSCSSRSH